MYHQDFKIFMLYLDLAWFCIGQSQPSKTSLLRTLYRAAYKYWIFLTDFSKRFFWVETSSHAIWVLGQVPNMARENYQGCHTRVSSARIFLNLICQRIIAHKMTSTRQLILFMKYLILVLRWKCFHEKMVLCLFGWSQIKWINLIICHGFNRKIVALYEAGLINK